MNRPARFVIRSEAISERVARLGGAELHHLRDVMRLRPGARVALFDERGIEYAGVIARFEAKHAVIEIAEYAAPQSAPRPLILAVAIIKGPRMDFLVEKAAELGASELWPVLCARGVIRAPGEARLERWRRLTIAAAKQSRALHPMEVRAPLDFPGLIRGLPRDTLGVICALGAEPLGPLLRRTRPHRVLLACGPEGDFDPAEQAAAEQAGFVRAGLGPNRLRSETAAIAALAVAAAALSELDGGS